MNKPALPFAFTFRSDGSATTVEIDTRKGPIAFGPPNGWPLNSEFRDTASDVIDASLIYDGGTAITKVSFSHGILVLNVPSSAVDSLHTITGVLIY